jgi:3-dehydroquinate synthase
MASDLSERLGLAAPGLLERMRRLVARAGLPVQAPHMPAERWLELMRVDKKAEDGAIRFVVIEGLGQAGMHAAPDELVSAVIAAHSKPQ